MSTEHLEKCCNLLSPENYMDKEVVSELLIHSNMIKSRYIVPFRIELDKNILTRKSPEEKSDLIIYYISQLMKVQGILPDYSLISFEVPENFYNLTYSNHTGELTNLTRYKATRHFLYALLFNEIQKVCFNFKIPFLTICTDLWVPLDVIDTEISKEYEKLRIGKPRSDTITQTTFETLRIAIRQLGFYNLKTVKALPNPAREKLISLLNDNELPYQIAMVDFLGFFDYILKEYGLSKNIAYNKIASLFSVTPRSVRGNVLVLQDYSKEDRQRYTSHKYKDQVKNDYRMLN